MFYRLSIAVALLTLFVGWLELSWTVALLCVFLIYLASGGWRSARLFCLTFPRDLKIISNMFKVIKNTRRIKRDNLTVGDMFQETVQKYSNKVAFMFEDKQWTFKEVDMFSNKVANYFQSIGYKKGDVVALFMENQPELVFFWLGLSKIGVVASLVNYNLRKEALSHCISIVKSKGLIYSSESSTADAVADIHSSMNDVELFEFGGGGGSNGRNTPDLLEQIGKCSDKPPAQIDEKRYNDVLFYIYTSGTTGLPKASVIRHSRFLSSSIAWGTSVHIVTDDVVYNVLPLYHSVGGILGIAAALSYGATVVVRRKFSASKFWEECIHYKATCYLYIGELCRYLLAQPPKETDKSHTLRWMSGGGLRLQIWNEFQARFNIPFIYEFYGATEGNAGLMNFLGHPGAIGCFPLLFPKEVWPVRILKMDPFTEELCRGPDGFCIPCKPGEVGQIVGKVDQNDFFRRYDGYVNRTATAKNVASDLLKKGDKWFLSGDTLVSDELGYFYFHDRLGDTFRWRGENVSTAEVESIMAKVVGLSSVVVFGVEIPGCEGRAGMAAIENPDGVIDIKPLGKKLPEVLPSYARPIFLRVTKRVDMTGSFRFQKAKLRKEGFNLSVVEDKLFYLDQKSSEYHVLTEEIYQKFQDGEMRF